MLCKNCGKRQATTHVKRTINGKTEEYHLCHECAVKLGVAGINPFDLNDLWGSLFGGTHQKTLSEQVICPSCGQSFSKIAKSGKMGCPECYKTFYNDLLPSLQKIHGKVKHVGKVPSNADEHAKVEYRLRELKEKLKSAVDSEDFESAAALRDEIREIENTLGGEQNA
jgi:protein arginine kinase activator